MLGCRHEGGCQPRYVTPATNSPRVSVGWSGIRRRLQSTTKRGSVKPDTFTCKRSTEESTLRTVAPADVSSPSTFHGSNAWRSSRWTPCLEMDPITGKRNSKWGANQSVSNAYPDLESSASTSFQSSQTKCGSMKRSRVEE